MPVFDELKVAGTLSLTREFDVGYNYDDDVRLLSIVGSMIIQYVKTRQEESEEIARLRQTNQELQNAHPISNRDSYLGKYFRLEAVFSS